MGVIENFAISFIANNIPTIKDAAKYLSKDTSLDKEMERCYQNALKKWCRNDGIRRSMSMRLFQNLESLKNYLQRDEHIDERELIELWANELRNDDLCYKFIIEKKVDYISDKADDKGIIATSIEGEYALIAAAMAKGGIDEAVIRTKLDRVIEGAKKSRFSI